MSLIIKNGYIITNDHDNRIIRNGAIFINENKISDIGPTSTILESYPNPDQVIDAQGRAVMPGLICSHMHFYSAFATGMPLNSFPPGFLNVLEHLWWKLDKALQSEDVYYSALLGYIQAVRHGTTTVVDHHASPSFINRSLDLIEKAGKEVGVRSNLCYEVTDRNGKDQAKQGLQENERYLKNVTENDGMFTGSLGLHASFTLDNDTLDYANNIVEEFDTGVHIHVAEGKLDVSKTKDKYNMTPIERLDRYNLLNSKSVIAHAIHLEKEDYTIIKKNNANVVHQPRSNMNNAVGVIDIGQMKQNDITVGMGTDGMSSDMKTELMVGSLLQKHHLHDNTVGTSEMYHALIKQNPKIIKKMTGQNLGQITSGFKADILISDYRPKTPIHPNNVMGHIMFGIINEPVHSTIINGVIRMENHHIKGIDEKAVIERSKELAQKVWNRID